MDNTPKDLKKTESPDSQSATESVDSQKSASKIDSGTGSKASESVPKEDSSSAKIDQAQAQSQMNVQTEISQAQAQSQADAAPKTSQAQAQIQTGATTKTTMSQVQSQTDAVMKTSQVQAQSQSDAGSKTSSSAVVGDAETEYFELEVQERTEAEEFASNVIEEVFERDPFLALENPNGDREAIVTTVTEITKTVVTTSGSLSSEPSKEIETTKIETRVHLEGGTDSIGFSTTDVRETTLKKTTEKTQDMESIHGPALAKWHVDLKPRNPNSNKGERYEIMIHRKGNTPTGTLPGRIATQSGGGSSRPPPTIQPRKKPGRA